MKQFMQSNLEFQQTLAGSLAQGTDVLARLPLGLSWFDVFPVDWLLAPQKTLIVVYPNLALMEQQKSRLEATGLLPDGWAMLDSEMPPHEERFLWSRVALHEVPLLMMTAQKLQSLTTFSQMVRQPNLGPIVIEQAHWSLPHLWGPSVPGARSYRAIGQLFSRQWTHRPPLFLFTQALPAGSVEALQKRFGLNQPQTLTYPLVSGNARFGVQRFVTQRQKFHKLASLITESQRASQETPVVVVCPRQQDLIHLASRLQDHGEKTPVLTFHAGLTAEEKELVRLQLFHETRPVLLCDREGLAELGLNQYMWKTLNLVLWTLPWSMPDLIQQVFPALPSTCDTYRVMVFYTREDTALQRKRLLAYRRPQDRKLPLSVRHLEEVRRFCVWDTGCRLWHCHNTLGEPEAPECGHCDNCLDEMRSSSLWRNLVRLSLF